MTYKCNYQLMPETNAQTLEETGRWGVTTQTKMQCGQLQLKMSMLDLHLIMQVIAFASEQMAKETVYRLQEIEKGIDQQMIERLQQDNLLDQTMNADDSIRASQTNNLMNSHRQSQKDKEKFQSLMQKVQEGNQNTVNSVVGRLSQTTSQFKRLTQGYTDHNVYAERQTFFRYIAKDILEEQVAGEFDAQQDDFKDVFPDLPAPKASADQAKSKPGSQMMQIVDEASSEDGNLEQDDDGPDSQEYQDNKLFNRTEEQSSYFTLMRSERQKTFRASMAQQRASQVQSSSQVQRADAPSHKTINGSSSFGTDPTTEKAGQQSSQGTPSEANRHVSSHVQSQLSHSASQFSKRQRASNYSSSFQYARGMSRKSSSHERQQEGQSSEDDFQSARDSFATARDEVEEDQDEVFYSFHEQQRPLLNDEYDKPNGLQASSASSFRGSRQNRRPSQFKNSFQNQQRSQDLVEEYKELPQMQICEEPVQKKSKPSNQNQTIRETTADLRRSDQSSSESVELDKEVEENENLPSFAKQEEPAKETAVVVEQEVQSSMQNIIQNIQEIRCESVSILAINDYDCGFTPVLQIELQQGILMNQDQPRDQPSVMNLTLPEIGLNYYNIELGEWEPLLEPTQMNLNIESTATDSKTAVRMDQPMNLNSTEECLKNLYHTYESWMQTPKFYNTHNPNQRTASENKANQEKELKKKSRYSQIKRARTTVGRKQTNESGQSEDEFGYDKGGVMSKNNKIFINQMRESIIAQPGLQKQKSQGSNRGFGNFMDSEQQVDESVHHRNNQQTVTPFSIANYTSRQIKIIRGGIKPGKFSEVKYLRPEQQQLAQSDQQQCYFLQPSDQSDYAVTYERLMGNQNRQTNQQQHRSDSIVEDLLQHNNRGSITNPNDISLNGTTEEAENLLEQKLLNLRNSELIGIQLSELDYVPFVDLNKNTGVNPYVHEISSRLSLSRSARSSAFKSNQLNLEEPLLDDDLQDFQAVTDANDEHLPGLIRNKVFYGTMLKGMRKFLIVRQPYCILNKTSFPYELRISEYKTGDRRLHQKMVQGESVGLDDRFCYGHTLQVRVLKNELEDMRSVDEEWSDPVQINTLLRLPLNDGTGMNIKSKDSKQPFTTCIKLQQGEINGTTDLVLLPPITIKNCLPCAIVVRQKEHQRNAADANPSNPKVKTLEQTTLNVLSKNCYQIDPSQEIQFHMFWPVQKGNQRANTTDNFREESFEIELGVDQFVMQDFELKMSQKCLGGESDFEIKDRSQNTLQIGLRKSYNDAGFNLVLFAHVVVLVETPQVLKNMQILYKDGLFADRRACAGQDQLAKYKFVMCNKDVDIIVGMKDSEQRLNYSKQLELKEGGNPNPFEITTQPVPNQAQMNSQRYDFVCTPKMQLANNESRIFTKVVQITPQYVLCNQTDRVLEIGQADNIQANHVRQREYQPQEKKEWYWPVGNLPSENLKIVFRRVTQQGVGMSSESSIREVLKGRNQDQDVSNNEKRYSEADLVCDWHWSKPISLSQMKDQDSFPILICETNGPRKKIYLVSKKVINSTTFIIFKAESEVKPCYSIRNRCPNVRIAFKQDGQQMNQKWRLREKQDQAYAHLDPQARVKTISVSMTIDRSVKKWNFQAHQCFERNFNQINIEEKKGFTDEFTYHDRDSNNRKIIMELKNDGLHTVLIFSLEGESKAMNKIQEPDKKKDPSQEVALMRSSFQLMLHSISLSIIGYTNTTVQQQTLNKEFKARRDRNEIALISIGGLEYNTKTDNKSNSTSTNISIMKFQIDNQTSQNPLFSTIVQRRDTSVNSPFLYFVLQRTFNKEINVDRIDLFDLRVAEYVLRLDDNFLMDISATMMSAMQINEASQQQEHPLFMLDNYYQQNGYLELYQRIQSDRSFANQVDDQAKLLEQQQKMALQELESLSKEQRHLAILPLQQQGVITISELRFNNQNLQDIPDHFRHWLMQDKSLEDAANMELVDFKISKLAFEVTFIFRTTQERNKVEGPLGYIQKSGLKVASIDELLLKFNEFKIENKLMSSVSFMNQIQGSFVDSAKSQILRSLLTIKLIGSLPNLLRHLSDGVLAVYETPRDGFAQSWYRGIFGIGVGTVLLLKHTVIGVFNTTQVATESWSEIVLLANFDKDYAIRHEEEVITERPKNFVEGLGFGARSALQSFPEMLYGFFSRPVIEGHRKGIKGVGFGLWEGVTGLLLKPISGALDLVAKTSEGVKNTCRIFEQKQKKGRIRMPRTFYGIQRKIKNFNEDDAFIVSNVLCQIKRGEFALDHFIDMKLIRTASDNQTPHFLLLSEENLFLIEASQKALVWHIEYKNITQIQNMQNGLLISLKESEDYAGRAQVGLPLDQQMSQEINAWFKEIMAEQF